MLGFSPVAATVRFPMPVLAQSVNFVDQLVDSFQQLGADIGNFLPRLVVALLLLLVGHWIAKWIAKLVVTGLDKLGADSLLQRAGIEPFLQQSGTSGLDLVRTVLWFLIFVIFVQIAAEVLGIDQLTELLNGLISYLPLLVVAIIVLFVAAAIANWAADTIRPIAEARGMGWIDDVVRWAILVIGVLAALDTANFAPSVTAKIENTLLQYLPLSVLVAGTIAFGIGGIDTAKQWWKKLAPKDTSRVDLTEGDDTPARSGTSGSPADTNA